MPRQSAPFADKKTSELMRTAAALLEVNALTIDHQVAAELRVRARWIEVARTDVGVSEERRRGIAAIEDAPSS